MAHGDSVQSVGPCELPRRVQSMLMHLGFQAQAVRNHEHHAERLPIRLPVDQNLGNPDRAPLRAEINNRASVADVRGQLESAPRAAEPRQGDAVETVIENLLRVRRAQHRNRGVIERQFALMGDRRTLRDVIVPGQGQRPAVLPDAREVRVAHRVAATIQPGPLAVPNAYRTVEQRLWKLLEQLTAHNRRESQFLVDAGYEMDPMLFEKVIRPGQSDVVPAQRRPLVSGDQASGLDARAPIPSHLLDRQAHQGLDTRHVCRARFQRVLIVKRHVTNWH